MNNTETIFEIRSCLEILTNDIKLILLQTSFKSWTAVDKIKPIMDQEERETLMQLS